MHAHCTLSCNIPLKFKNHTLKCKPVNYCKRLGGGGKPNILGEKLPPHWIEPAYNYVFMCSFNVTKLEPEDSSITSSTKSGLLLTLNNGSISISADWKASSLAMAVEHWWWCGHHSYKTNMQSLVKTALIFDTNPLRILWCTFSCTRTDLVCRLCQTPSLPTSCAGDVIHVYTQRLVRGRFTRLPCTIKMNDHASVTDNLAIL